ncbi:MAG: hypothetical protein V3V08_17235 [Nannocystaceae bacterium]
MPWLPNDLAARPADWHALAQLHAPTAPEDLLSRVVAGIDALDRRGQPSPHSHVTRAARECPSVWLLAAGLVLCALPGAGAGAWLARDYLGSDVANPVTASEYTRLFDISPPGFLTYDPSSLAAQEEGP